MYHHDDKPAFRCAVANECSRAFIRVGWSRFQATVTEVSRDGFTLRLPSKASRGVSQGNKLRLYYSQEVWLVSVESKSLDSDGKIALKVRREEDLTRVVFQGDSGFGSLLNGVSLRSADPGLSLGVILGVTLVVLISPGLGDELGTSSYLSELFQSSLTTVWEAVTGQ